VPHNKNQTEGEAIMVKQGAKQGKTRGPNRTGAMGGLSLRLDLGVRRDYRPAGNAAWGIRFSGHGLVPVL
jgi:hypothetical protein